MPCIPEEDLLELASGERSLAGAPAIEAHLADCPACSGLLCTLIAPLREPVRARVGTTLGKYRLEGLIGAGAMGEVYRARDTHLGREVAVKLLAATLADSPDRIRRLEAEARAAAAIAHPNIVTIFDAGVADGTPFIASELIEGETLRSLLDRGAVTDPRALGLQLARGVAAAHAQGVVHRDLKPGNLLVTSDGTLKILDFGLAKVANERDADSTEPGTLVGTSGYLSPEQARGEPADARSDIFAIGAILYELYGGTRAFGGATFAERLSAVLRDTPPALADPAWPVIARCLEKDPKKRFQSAGDLAWVLQGEPHEAPRRRAVAVVSRRAFLAGTAATGVAGIVVGRALNRAAPPRAPLVPTYEQLTYRPGRIDRARFTPDGGSIIYAALWEDAPSTIYTQRLAGGGIHALELPPASILSVSSRGQLAISIDHHFGEGFQQRGQLALAPVDGGQPRSLGLDVQDADFTPDGDQLAILRAAGGRFRLELPAGRVLLEAGWLSNVRVSPDGRHVAVCVHASHHDNQGDVVVVPRDGGAARTIGARWSTLDGVAWAASGRALWISAAREGSNNSVHAHDLEGRELLHVSSIGRVRLFDARTGALAVAHTTGRVRCAGKASAGAELDLGLSDVSLVGAIAHDGSAIVTSELGDVDVASGIYLRATDATTAHRLGGGIAFDIDGRGVLGSRGAAHALTVYPIDGSPPRPLALGDLSGVGRARWCADGVIVAASRGGRPDRLWRVDATGTSPLTDEGNAPAFAVSPDGKSFAHITGEQLVVDRSPVPGVFAGDVVCGWASTREVYVRSYRTPIRVRRVDITSGTATPVVEIMPARLGLRGVNAFAIDRAGDTYAYSYTQELARLYRMTVADV